MVSYSLQDLSEVVEDTTGVVTDTTGIVEDVSWVGVDTTGVVESMTRVVEHMTGIGEGIGQMDELLQNQMGGIQLMGVNQVKYSKDQLVLMVDHLMH